MRLLSASVDRFRLALRRSLTTSRGALHEREGFILKLYASSAQCGAGEASPAYWIDDEQLDDTRASLHRIIRAVSDQPDTNDLRVSMLDRDAGLTPAAACALDAALLELEARARHVAVASLLGADQLRAIPVCALLAGDTPAAIASEAARAINAGYRCLKLKVGAVALEDDVRRVREVRGIAGPQAAIRLDANRAWSPAQARDAMLRFDDFELEFLEEPLQRATPDAIAELRRYSRTPIALDETIGSPDDLAKFAECRAADVVVLKAARLRGVTRAMRLGKIALEAGMQVVVTDSIESQVGMSAAVHLAAAIATPSRGIGLGGLSILAQSVPPPLGAARSSWVRPTAGLGVICYSNREIEDNA